MEISLLSKYSLRIKGKRASFVVDPPGSAKASAGKQDKAAYAAVIVLSGERNQLTIQSEAVVIDSPGEYEIGGIKMNAVRGEGGIVYNPVVDGVEILLGTLSSFEKMQHKLKEQHIVVVNVDSLISASFIPSLASSMVIFYGEHAKEVVAKLGKENVRTMSSYSVTPDKLPQEVETIVLE